MNKIGDVHHAITRYHPTLLQPETEKPEKLLPIKNRVILRNNMTNRTIICTLIGVVGVIALVS